MKKHLILSTSVFFLLSIPAIADDSDPAKGLWDRHCKKCHAEDGSGSTAIGKKLEIKDYTSPEALGEFSDEELFDMTKNGVDGTKMGGYGDKLSDDEIKALVAYMRSMSAS